MRVYQFRHSRVEVEGSKWRRGGGVESGASVFQLVVRGRRMVAVPGAGRSTATGDSQQRHDPATLVVAPPLSSRGLGRRPLTAETRVRIPVAVRVRGPATGRRAARARIQSGATTARAGRARALAGHGTRRLDRGHALRRRGHAAAVRPAPSGWRAQTDAVQCSVRRRPDGLAKRAYARQSGDPGTRQGAHD